ncbi:MAG: hypothetical protein ACTINZ_10870 [Microbacterium gubbeenense]|uniref:hypothetical protein n=1 Tax=Microbacterium gubbeenense TaxID=159896 RepID=UPI003F9E3FA9
MALSPAEIAARNAGFPMPEGGDRISDGDDAIRALGVTAHNREYNRPPLTTADRLDSLTKTGNYPIPSVAVADAIGSPFSAMGGVRVEQSGWSGANGPILRQTVWSYTQTYSMTRTRLSNGLFGSWDAGILRPDLGTMVGNTMRLSRWLANNPAVYTGGRGAVAFTIDHGLTKFKAAGLPGVFAGYGWGYGLALNDSTLASAENNGASTADILSWAGAEIWNHGYNHAATGNEQTAKTIVVQGKTALEARFGREVFGFIPAGVGPTGLAGFDGGSKPEMFATTLAGQMILEHHAVTTGYMGTGGVRNLDGTVQQGIGRFTMDALTVSRIKLQIDQAINDRVGIMFMVHPTQLDVGSNLTTAGLLEVLAYARTRQQAGELAVLSPGELVRADAGLTPSDASTLPVRVSDLERNTGTRKITTATGDLYVYREGTRVEVDFQNFRPIGPGDQTIVALPQGFRPVRTAYGNAVEGSTPRGVRAFFYSPWNVQALGIAAADSWVHGSLKFTTADPWPTTLPGTPA